MDKKNEKEKIRKKILEKRNVLNNEFVESKSKIIVEKIVEIIENNNFKNIMIYMDMKNEVKITKLINYFSEKNFYIPKIVSKENMRLNKYKENELVKNKYGIYESNSSEFSSEEIIDIVIVPAVAFDLDKNRIGFGGGYYDRFLERLREIFLKKERGLPLILGVCYDFQILEKIPFEKYDEKVDFIITECRKI